MILVGSYVEITGGKYIGHYANVTGFTPTGQCQISLDQGAASKIGAIKTLNYHTRCASHHAKVVDRKVLVVDDPVKDPDDKTTPSMELVLLSKLVALQLADAKPEFQDKNLFAFIRLVKMSLL